MEKKDEDIEKLRLKLKEKGVSCSILLWYFKDDKLGGIDHSNYRRYRNYSDSEIREELKTIGVFDMHPSTYEFYYSNWW